ncbi:MAG: nodulation protein NodH, partial [Paracoccaceae bacterium]
ALETGFDRQTLRQWKATHPGQRSFTVLRHPLARAHAAFSDFIAREWVPELRPYLKRVHRYQLPPKGMGYASAAEYREGLVVFLELIKHILAGRTELKLPLHCATQGAVLQGFAQIQPPDIILREDRLAEGLTYLTRDVGTACPALPPNPEKLPFNLAEIYGPDLESAARDTYWRDYTGLGFGDWTPPQAA